MSRDPDAQELEEGDDRVDGDGELALPNDEVLGEEVVEDDLAQQKRKTNRALELEEVEE